MTGGNSVTNATSRSLEAPSPPEPPVTTDPALTNVTGDNYQQRRLLIGQQLTILASDWPVTSSASFININFVPEPGPGQRRHSVSGAASASWSVFTSCSLSQVLADHLNLLLVTPTEEVFTSLIILVPSLLIMITILWGNTHETSVSREDPSR